MSLGTQSYLDCLGHHFVAHNVAGDALVIATLLPTLLLSPQNDTGTLENVTCCHP
jgi:hypothetical protein